MLEDFFGESLPPFGGVWSVRRTAVAGRPPSYRDRGGCGQTFRERTHTIDIRILNFLPHGQANE